MIKKIDVSMLMLTIGSLALALHPLWVELIVALGIKAGLVDNIIMISFLVGAYLLLEAKTGEHFLKEMFHDFVEIIKE